MSALSTRHGIAHGQPQRDDEKQALLALTLDVDCQWQCRPQTPNRARHSRYSRAMEKRSPSSVPWVENAPHTDARRFAPATQRNREAITEVLRTVLPSHGTALEIASGSGEHVVHFGAQFAGIKWIPSDPDTDARASIAAWSAEAKLSNISPPIALNAASEDWPIQHADAIVCINMVHISPFSATVGLLHGACRILPPEGVLYLYGPYRRQGTPTAPSNEAFDASLKSREPQWGLRWVEDVEAEANRAGLRLQSITEMPANNLSLVFRKRP